VFCGRQYTPENGQICLKAWQYKMWKQYQPKSQYEHITKLSKTSELRLQYLHSYFNMGRHLDLEKDYLLPLALVCGEKLLNGSHFMEPKVSLLCSAIILISSLLLSSNLWVSLPKDVFPSGFELKLCMQFTALPCVLRDIPIPPCFVSLNL
jgi:hypothetical protein